MHGPTDALYRAEHGRIVSALIRLLRDFDAAEEVAQETFAAALAQWPDGGVPDEPAAWLWRVARNKAVDRLRSRARREVPVGDARELEERLVDASPAPDDDDREGIGDDRLRLVFTCCHPALSVEAQVALTLRTLCGLSTEEIARAFLLPPATMAQRLVRAKAKIKDAGIPYRVPPESERAERLASVMAVVYLVFNEGYAATSGDTLSRRELTSEAIRLGRLLVELSPDTSETLGLLALMLLTDARKDARVDDAGALVLLEHQDRSRWVRAEIDEGLALVERALVLARPHPGPYALQATIAAVHARARTAVETDWRQIAALYGVLARVGPSPVVELNRAVAIAMADGPAAALPLLDVLDARGELAGYHLLSAARGDLLRRLGRTAEAIAAYRRALADVGSAPERRFLEARLRELEREPGAR